MLIHECHGHLPCPSVLEEFFERAAAIAAATPRSFGGLFNLLAVVLSGEAQKPLEDPHSLDSMLAIHPLSPP